MLILYQTIKCIKVLIGNITIHITVQTIHFEESKKICRHVMLNEDSFFLSGYINLKEFRELCKC